MRLNIGRSPAHGPGEPHRRSRRPAVRRVAAYLLILILTLLAYLPTFTGDFILDDQTLIKRNTYIRELHPLSSYLSQEDGIVDPRDKGIYRTSYYRPLLNATYWLDYKLWGLNPAGYRATNVIAHLLTCLLLYELIFLLTGNRRAAFWGTLLFALHPVQTESVAMVVNRNNIIVTFFVLASLYSYITWWEKRSATALTISLISFVGAVFSKEFGLVAVPVFFLYQRLLARKKAPCREIAGYLPYLIIVALYLSLRALALSSSMAIPDDLWTRVGFVPYLLLYNLSLLFFPFNLHSFFVAYPPSVWAWPPLLATGILLTAGLLLYRFRNRRLLLFSALSFCAALLPVLNLISSASMSLIAMRWLYLPSALLIVGVAWGLVSLMDRQRGSLLIVCVPLALYLGGLTCLLNQTLWHDNETFLLQEVIHFENPMYAGSYAEMRLQQRQYPEAEKFFAISIDAFPPLSRNYINYASLLIDTGRPDQALQVLRRAESLIMVNGEKADWYNNLGVALAMQGRWDGALFAIQSALARTPDNPDLHSNAAALLIKLNRIPEARIHLHRSEALRITAPLPDHDPTLIP